MSVCKLACAACCANSRLTCMLHGSMHTGMMQAMMAIKAHESDAEVKDQLEIIRRKTIL